MRGQENRRIGLEFGEQFSPPPILLGYWGYNCSFHFHFHVLFVYMNYAWHF